MGVALVTGSASDVADLIAAVVATKYLTGEIILLDGGLNLR